MAVLDLNLLTSRKSDSAKGLVIVLDRFISNSKLEGIEYSARGFDLIQYLDE